MNSPEVSARQKLTSLLASAGVGAAIAGVWEPAQGSAPDTLRVPIHGAGELLRVAAQVETVPLFNRTNGRSCVWTVNVPAWDDRTRLQVVWVDVR